MSNKSERRSKEPATNRSESIPVFEERVQIDKAVVDTGSVNVRKTIHTKSIDVEATLSQDHVTVERVPVNQPVTTAPEPIRYEGNTLIVSVVQEELVIQKRLILVEEIRITRVNENKHVQTPASVRREEITIERKGADGPSR